MRPKYSGGMPNSTPRTIPLHLGGRPKDLTTYQAILKSYAYQHSITPVAYMQALKALQSPG